MSTVNTLGYALLCALHKGPLTGYELVRRMSRPIGYYWSARQSQIYPELGRLAQLGLIASTGEPGPGPHQRRTHRLTEAGRAALAQWLVQPPAPHAPRDELVLRTYAAAVADPAGLHRVYAAEAERLEDRLADYQRQRREMVAQGADKPDHRDFGAFATLELGIASTRERSRWCRWLADVMAARTTG